MAKRGRLKAGNENLFVQPLIISSGEISVGLVPTQVRILRPAFIILIARYRECERRVFPLFVRQTADRLLLEHEQRAPFDQTFLKFVRQSCAPHSLFYREFVFFSKTFLYLFSKSG